MNALLRILSFLAVCFALMAVFVGLATLAHGVKAILFVPFVLTAALAMTGFWIWMLVDCVNRLQAGEKDKIIWLIVVVLVPVLGALIYFLAGRGPAQAQAGNQPPHVVVLIIVACIVGLPLLLILSKVVLGMGFILITFASFAGWVWMLVDCGKRLSAADEKGRTTWIIWLLILLFTFALGAFVYYMVNYFGKKTDRPWVGASTPVPPAPSYPPPPQGAPPPVSPQPTSRPKGQCPKCGAPLGPDAPEGLCPRCLLQMNLGAPTQFTGEPGARFTASAPPPPMPPEEIAKHFPQLEILECLGRGGMGVVYKARQPRLNRLVVLKILAPGRQQDPQFAERFLREAQVLAKLNHPNIVTVYDFGESDGLFYLLMEYVDGVSLRGLMQGGKVESAQALAIVPRICEALQYAHEQGVVHRDIKPENVLLDKQGRVKIADFGIARMLGVEGLPAHTRDRYVIGTPYYMAPEQVEHPLEVDHRADIYSLGVVFYEMLTGELPLGRFALPSQKVQVDVRLDDVVLRTLEKEPQLRYQQAGQVKTDVENITGVHTTGGGAPVPGMAVGAPPPPPTLPPVAPAGGDSSGWPQGESRFSGKAIIGVVWAMCAALAIMPLGYHVVLPGEPMEPPFWNKLLMMALFVLGITSPLGTTILGWTAVGDIRRSNGKIHGLWLAVFDGLLFPILALDGLILFMCHFAANPILDHFAQFSDNRGAFFQFHRLDFLAPGIFLSLIADALLVWLAARAVNRSINPARENPASLGRTIFKSLVVLVVLGLIGAAGLAAIWLFTARASNNPAALIDAVSAKLPDYSLRYDTLQVQWSSEMNRVTIVLVNAQEMKGVDGQNVWTPVDGSLYGTYIGNGMWEIQGDHFLGNVQFTAPGPDTGEPLPMPVGQPQASLFPTPTPAFGPTIERDLQAGLILDLKNALISFESGKIFSISDLPSTNMTFEEDDAWFAQRGVDASCIGLPTGYPVLSGLLFTKQSQTRFMAVRGMDAMKLAADELPAMWQQGPAQDYADYGGWDKLPASFLFKTRSGSMGVVEIVAILDKPTGLRIRYKLVTPTPPAARAENTALSTNVLNSLQVELRQAQQNVDHMKQEFDAGQVEMTEVINAREKVDVLQAQISGDPVKVAQARLAAAQQRLALDDQRLRAGLITREDYDNAKLEVAARQTELAGALDKNPAAQPNPPVGSAAR